MTAPLYKWVYTDGSYRAVVTDWAWLKAHTYKELCTLLEELNEKAPEKID